MTRRIDLLQSVVAVCFAFTFLASINSTDAQGQVRESPTVWVMDANGKNRKWLCEGQRPNWSPDGKTIAFTSDRLIKEKPMERK